MFLFQVRKKVTIEMGPDDVEDEERKAVGDAGSFWEPARCVIC